MSKPYALVETKDTGEVIWIELFETRDEAVQTAVEYVELNGFLSANNVTEEWVKRSLLDDGYYEDGDTRTSVALVG